VELIAIGGRHRACAGSGLCLKWLREGCRRTPQKVERWRAFP